MVDTIITPSEGPQANRSLFPGRYNTAVSRRHWTNITAIVNTTYEASPDVADQFIDISSPASQAELDLPDSDSASKGMVLFYYVSDSTNGIQINPAGGDTINGSGTPLGPTVGTQGRLMSLGDGNWIHFSLGTATGPGDMLISVYDPTAVSGDAFSMDNMAETATGKVFTDVERTKLSTVVTGETAEMALNTGLLTGGVVTISGDTTKIDISAGTGVTIDWSTPGTPVRTDVSWTAFTAQTVDDIATEFYTSLSINSAGSLIQDGGADHTPQQKRTNIILQGIVHSDNVNVTSVGSSSHPAYEQVAALIDYVHALGPINSANNILGNAAADLTIDKAVGSTVLPFINRAVDVQNPTIRTDAAESPIAAFNYSYADGSGGHTTVFDATEIDPGMYDDGTGTLANVTPSNRFTIQRSYYFSSPDITTISYGTTLYTSIVEAEAAIFTEPTDINPLFAAGTLTTALIVRGNATDMTDDAQRRFVPIVGARGGSGGTTSVDHGGLTGLSDDDHVEYLLGDGTREMTGGLMMGANPINAEQQIVTSTSNASTVSWLVGNFAYMLMTENTTIAFTTPAESGDLVLKLKQGGSGSYTVTWPSNVRWVGGSAPSLSTTVGHFDQFRIYYDAVLDEYGIDKTGPYS